MKVWILFFFIKLVFTYDKIDLPFIEDYVDFKCNIPTAGDMTIVSINDIFALRYNHLSHFVGTKSNGDFLNKDENPLLRLKLNKQTINQVTCSLRSDGGFGEVKYGLTVTFLPAEKPKIDLPTADHNRIIGVVMKDPYTNSAQIVCQPKDSDNALQFEMKLIKVSTGEVLKEEINARKLTYSFDRPIEHKDLGPYKCQVRQKLSDDARHYFGDEYVKKIDARLAELVAEETVNMMEHSKPRLVIKQKKIYTTFNQEVVLNAEVAGEPKPLIECNSTETAIEKFNISPTKRVIREIEPETVHIRLGRVFSDNQTETNNDEPIGDKNVYMNKKTKANLPNTLKFFCTAKNSYGEARSEPIEITIMPDLVSVLSPFNGEYSDFYELKVRVKTGEDINRLKGKLINRNRRESRFFEEKPQVIQQSETPEGGLYEYSLLIKDLDNNTDYALSFNLCTKYDCNPKENEFQFNTNQMNDENNFASYISKYGAAYNSGVRGLLNSLVMLLPFVLFLEF